jgi:hypothetical protein
LINYKRIEALLIVVVVVTAFVMMVVSSAIVKGPEISADHCRVVCGMADSAKGSGRVSGGWET